MHIYSHPTSSFSYLALPLHDDSTCLAHNLTWSDGDGCDALSFCELHRGNEVSEDISRECKKYQPLTSFIIIIHILFYIFFSLSASSHHANKFNHHTVVAIVCHKKMCFLCFLILLLASKRVNNILNQIKENMAICRCRLK
jgi:hypothetical protein